MTEQFLYEELDVVNKFGKLLALPTFVQKNLSNHVMLREYQEEAFRYFITYFENGELSKNKQIHTLFHMATGSGKTVIMAGLILYLYSKGYRNFLFFVNQTNVLEKTKENFLNHLSNKYLFADEIEYLGEKIDINEVHNFSALSNSDIGKDINICFMTTQALHGNLSETRENGISYRDFEDNKVVFISDESHHVNSMTKSATKAEKDSKKSWEESVLRAFHSNKDNILLEFTATADLNDKNVTAKYIDKIIYNYPLAEFRKSGYTKDFQNFSTNSNFWERALMAIIMSEYRKYLFADAGINMKPVVLFKSKKIKDSKAFYDEFFEKLKHLSPNDLEKLYETEMNTLQKALNYFKDKDTSLMLLVNSLKESFSEDKCIIMNGAEDNTPDQQLQVNSLEDANNPIRFIFAVDMLNEGWDVLNLFDIVRLYDTRQSGKNISPYTIKEAQLIGRGARYCPFKVQEDQERFKRKYDHDLENDNRILETMYFHSKDDSKYITELKKALIQTGMQDEEPIKRTYQLKESFKESDIYQKGYVFSNRRITKDRSRVTSIEESKKNKVYQFTVADSSGYLGSLLGEENSETILKPKKILVKKFKDINYNILSGAAESYRELRFSVLQEKYPHLQSMREFLTSDDYLGNNSLEIHYSADRVRGRDIFDGLVLAFNDIASYVLGLKPEFEGSKEFYPKKISDVIKDKSIYVSHVDEHGGTGASQNDNINENLQLSLFDMDWYVFTDNYGTSEEKLFLKYFQREIEPLLAQKNIKFFLIRNERIPELAIYSFKDGERFEPDFLLFVEKESASGQQDFQFYVEPKGGHLLEKDEWKEKFLAQINEESKIVESAISKHQHYEVIGLPFYNEEYRHAKFDEALKSWISNL